MEGDKAMRLTCDSGVKLAMPLDGGVRIHHTQSDGKMTVTNQEFRLRLFLSGMDPEDVHRLRSCIVAGRNRRHRRDSAGVMLHREARAVHT